MRRDCRPNIINQKSIGRKCLSLLVSNVIFCAVTMQFLQMQSSYCFNM